MGATQSSESASAQCAQSTSLSQEDLFTFPLEILEEIFLNLPPHQVVCICRLVCHQWKEVTDNESLWKERCRREGYRLRDASKIPKDWRLFYFLCKKRRNLLKNPRGEYIMKNWEMLENGGHCWKVEEVMVPHPNEAVQKNFVTSFAMCKKSQLIDLEKEGYNPSFMDQFQPDIKISDWYAPRWDCGSEYVICVELLNQRKKPIQTFAPETIYFQQWNDQKWNQMTHVFQDYGPGVRYIRFTHGGKDTQFWAGWYGIRVTDSCVEICPAMKSSSSSNGFMYSQRTDCGSQYKIRVELLNQRKRPVQTFAPETVYLKQWDEEKWIQMTHVFQNYGPGVRYIHFTHRGKDTQF